MFTIQRGLNLTLALGGLAVFACSDGLPDEKNDAPAGGAGTGATQHEDAGASNGGNGDPGDSSAGEAGANPTSSDGGSATTEPSESQGGNNSAQGGAPNTSGSGNALAGSAGTQGGGTSSGGVVSVLGSLSLDCQAAPPIDTSVPRAPGLLDKPSSGHACDATVEPNGSVGEACQLTLGTEVQTQLSAPDDQTDNFVFHAEAGVTYTLDISTKGCTGAFNYDHLNVTAKSLASAGQTPQINNVGVPFDSQKAFEIQSNTTSDELIAFTTSQSCQYRFKVYQSAAQGLEHGVDHEPDNTPSSASAIELNRWVSSSQLSGPQDTLDYFTVPVQGGVTYSIRVTTAGCSGAFNYDSIQVTGWSLVGGVQSQKRKPFSVAFNNVGDAEFTPTASGDELLEFYTSQTCAYKFYIVPSTICGLGHDAKADYEPNNTTNTPAEIALNQQISAQLQQPDDKADYYTFAVEPQTTYTLTASAANCEGPFNEANLSFSLWSGRSEQLLSKSGSLAFKSGNTPFQFTTGNAPQELLKISTGASCAYKFSVSKG